MLHQVLTLQRFIGRLDGSGYTVNVNGTATEPVVLFEDEHVLAVDKPAGLVCHSAQRPGQPSLVDWIRNRGITTPRMVNRLDRETSGIVLVAKSSVASAGLGKQVLRRELAKEYIAICFGLITPDEGTVDEPIAVSHATAVFTRRVVDRQQGKSCVTHWTVTERLLHGGKNGYTVMRLRPVTGRAHQLRVHMAWLGHAMVGDKIYGPDEHWYLDFIRQGVTPAMLEALRMSRQALHASVLGWRDPVTREPRTAQATLPADMAEFIEEHR